MQYRFGSFRYDPRNARLSGPDGDIALRPMTLRLLEALLQSAPDLVTRDALLDRVWGRQAVSTGVLAQSVRELRRALGDDAQAPRYIETRHRIGYCFVAPVERGATSAEASDSPAAAAPAAVAPAAATPAAANLDAAVAPAVRPERRARRLALPVALALAALGAGALAWWSALPDDRAPSASAAEVLDAGRPQEPTALAAYRQGLVALRQEDLQQAQDAFERSLAREPEAVATLAALARTLADRGELAQAREWTQRAMALRAALPRVEQLRLEGFAARIAGDADLAAMRYASVFQLEPGDGQAGLQLAEAQLAAGRGRAAADTLAQVRALDSPHADAAELALLEARIAASRGDQAARLAAARQARAQAGDPRTIAASLLEIAWAQLLLGRMDSAREGLAALDAQLAHAPWPAAVPRRLLLQGTLLREDGAFDAAIQAMERAAAGATALGQRATAAVATREAAYVEILAGRHAAARARLAAVQEEFTATGNPRELASTLDVLSVGLQRDGDLPGALEAGERALALYRSAGDGAGEAAARTNLASALARAGRTGEAREHWEQALALFERHGDVRGAAVIHGNLAILHGRAGRPEAARDANEAALAGFQQAGATLDAARLQFNLGVQDRRAGRIEQAHRRFEDAVRGFATMQARDFHLQAVASLGELLLRRADLAAADALLASLEISDDDAAQRRAAVVTASARLAALRGDFEAAATRFEQARQLRATAGLDEWVRMSELDLAELAARRGELRQAEASARLLRRAFVAADDPTAALRAGVLLAGALHAQGREQAAARLLDQLEAELASHPDALLALRLDLARASSRGSERSPALLQVAERARSTGFELMALRAELLAGGAPGAAARQALHALGVRVEDIPPPLPY